MKTVFVPGYGNSEPEHWQRLWYKDTPNSLWVEQKDWFKPDQKEWMETLHFFTQEVEEPILFIAHSLGCITVVDWAKEYAKDKKVLGALLVAPPDVSTIEDIIKVKGYESINEGKLSFPSLCIYSSDDPYASSQKTLEYANSWGSEVVSVGKKGHINLSSKLGYWEEGRELLKSSFRDIIFPC